MPPDRILRLVRGHFYFFLGREKFFLGQGEKYSWAGRKIFLGRNEKISRQTLFARWVKTCDVPRSMR